MTDCVSGPIGEAFHHGSLINFDHRLKNGLPIDAERIAAIKMRNPEWREHEAFRTYCEDFENGRIRPKRGRPRQSRSPLRYMVASFEYPIYLKLLQRWRRQRRYDSMIAAHYDAALHDLDNCHAAAEIVRAKFRLPYSADTFLVKMSQERQPR